MAQMADHPLTDVQPLDLGQFEHQRIAHMGLLDRGLRDVELARLAVVIGEGLAALAQLGTGDRGGVAGEATLGAGARPARFAVVVQIARPAVGLVVDPPLGAGHRHVAVLLEIADRAFGCVDRDMREVGAAEALELGIEIGEIAALEQRVLAEVHARKDILGEEGDLLGLGEEIIDIAIER